MRYVQPLQQALLCTRRQRAQPAKRMGELVFGGRLRALQRGRWRWLLCHPSVAAHTASAAAGTADTAADATSAATAAESASTSGATAAARSTTICAAGMP